MTPASIRKIGEEGLIRWIARKRPDRAPGVLLGIGDDAAVLRFTPGRAVTASVDALVEGVHFRRDWHTPEQIGRKAAAVNLSDMAAMGAMGKYLLCQGGVPPDTDPDFLRRVLQGLIGFSRRRGLALVGGDLVGTDGPLFLAVTILGEVRPGRAITRGGARPGDLLVVSGAPGESGAGLRLLEAGIPPTDRAFGRLLRKHLQPEPRTALGLLAAASGTASAGIDLSDGLSVDLGHLCEASLLTAEVDPATLPRSPLMLRAARHLGIDPLTIILSGGEDYELLLAVRPDRIDRFLKRARREGHRLTVIGRFLHGKPAAFLGTGRQRRPLLSRGFDHLAPR